MRSWIICYGSLLVLGLFFTLFGDSGVGVRTLFVACSLLMALCLFSTLIRGRA